MRGSPHPRRASPTSRGEAVDRRPRGPPQRDAPWSAAQGLQQLDAALVGTQGRGIGNRGLGERRNGPAHAKKNGMTHRQIAYGVIPPAADAEFVAPMEEVLATYEKPYNPHVPVLCMDEQPVQLRQETRVPMAATATPGKRVDYDDERAGRAAIFLCAAPVAGWRDVAVRARNTKSDWAIEMARWLEGRYASCGKVIVVFDNPPPPTKGACYAAVAPERARARVRRLEFCDTPTHGSWLNSAENARSALTRQCVADRRFGDVASLREETKAWSNDVNATQRGVDWHMKIDDARTKLKSVYPTIKL